MNCLRFEHKKELRFGSRISVRNNVILYAIKENRCMELIYRGQMMTLSVNDLKVRGFHNRNSKHVARYPGYGMKVGEKYYLVDFTFVPDGERKRKDNPDQIKLI